MDENIIDELLTISDELTRAFNSFESFKEYYNTYLATKEPEVWEVELKRKLDKIKNYLEGFCVGKINKEQVQVWFKRIENLNGNVSAISEQLNNDLMEHEAYKDLPEAFFHEDIIKKHIQETGKTYEELEPTYLKIIQDGINSLRSIRPYSKAGLSIIGKSLKELKADFGPLIKEDNLKKRNDSLSKTKTLNNKSIISPPIGKGNVKTFQLLNGQFLVSTLHSNLVANPGLIDGISVTEFKKLFSSIPESITVNWKGNKNQLSYFINQLINKKVIKSYGAWMATIKYFTVNGDPITNKNIRKIEPMETTTQKRIDQVLSFLNSSPTK
jgi:hypothetical protein